MWQCPTCKREFSKTKQNHSCAVFPLEKHFINKDYARKLFDTFVERIRKDIGPIKIESLPCCIHMVCDYTFGAVWALRDRIRIDLRVDHKVTGLTFYKEFQMSPNRYLYHFDIMNEKEITPEIMALLKESYSLHDK